MSSSFEAEFQAKIPDLAQDTIGGVPVLHQYARVITAAAWRPQRGGPQRASSAHLLQLHAASSVGQHPCGGSGPLDAVFGGRRTTCGSLMSHVHMYTPGHARTSPPDRAGAPDAAGQQQQGQQPQGQGQQRKGQHAAADASGWAPLPHMSPRRALSQRVVSLPARSSAAAVVDTAPRGASGSHASTSAAAPPQHAAAAAAGPRHARHDHHDAVDHLHHHHHHHQQQQQQAAAAAAGSSSPPATLDSEMGDTRSPEANALLRSSIDAANFSHGDALFVTASGEDWVEPSRGALSDDDSVYASAGASPFGVLEGEAAGGDEVALVQAAFLDCDGDGFYGGGGAAAAAPRVPPAAAPTDGLILVGGGVGEVSANVMLSSGSARGGSLDIFGGGCSGAWALGNGNDGGAAPPAVAEISMVWPPVLCASDPAPLSITLYGGSGGAGPPCERERECESTLLVMAGASMDVVAALPVPPGAAVLTLDARQLRPRACATADKPPSAHAHAHRHPAAAAGASAPAASKAQAAVPGRQHGSPYDDGGSPSEGAGAAGTAGCGITVLTMFNILSVAGGDDDVPMQSCSPAINVLCAPPEVAAELSDHLGVMAAQLLSLRVNTHLPHLQVRDVHGFTFLPGAGSTRGAAAAAAHVHTFDVPRPPEAGSSLERGHATTSAASPQLAGDEARAPPARGGLRTLRSMPPPGSHKVRLDALGRWTVNVRRPLEAMSTLEEEAVRAAWASHFQPLVQEIAYLLTCVPGAFNDDALAWDHRTYVKALAGLVGFLEHHACWHTLSALLSHSTPLGVCLCFRGHRVRGARLGAAALQALLADATHDDVSIVFRRNASDGVHEHDGATPGGGAGGSAGVDACVDGGAGAQQQQRHASTGGVCSVGGAASGSRASGPTSLAWQSQGRSVDDGSGSGGAAAAAAAASYLCHSWDAHMLCGPHAPHAHPEGDLGLCSAMSLGDVLDKWSQEWLACEPPCCGDMRAAGSGATTLVAAPPMRAQLPPWHPACAGPASAGSAGQAAAGLPRLRHLAAAPRSNPSYGSGIDSPLAVGGGAAGHARLTTLPCVAAVSDAGWGSAALQLQLAAVLVVSTIAAVWMQA